MMRSVLVALLVCLATAAASAAGEVRAAKDPVAGSYIVVFKADAVRAPGEARSQRPTVAAAAQELARAHGGSVSFVYQHALEGFAVELAPAEAAEARRRPAGRLRRARPGRARGRQRRPRPRGASTGSTSATCR